MLQNKVICLVGVCGAGMAPLAIYLVERGAVVYGWDDLPDPKVKDMLISKHIVFLPEKILPPRCEFVVVSSAIHVDTDEICCAATKNEIPIYKRGIFLSKAVSDRKLIAIVGSHGKTSVCANMAELALQSGLHIDYVVGGFFKDDIHYPAACFADSEWVIAEVDESDCTIEAFNPQVTVALNYDDDHIANYSGPEGLKAAFSRLFERTKETIFLVSDDQALNKLAEKSQGKVVYLRDLPKNNFLLRNQEIALRVFETIFGVKRRSDFHMHGVKRRNDVFCTVDNITFVHDYAHHPTEVRALLDFVRDHYPEHFITVVFQPHRVSRTKQYYKEFAQVLQDFDSIILLDIYRAFEEQSDGVTSSLIFDRISNDKKMLVEKLEDLGAALHKYCSNLNKDQPNLVLFVCAGNLLRYAKNFVDEWQIEALFRHGSRILVPERPSLRPSKQCFWSKIYSCRAY